MAVVAKNDEPIELQVSESLQKRVDDALVDFGLHQTNKKVLVRMKQQLTFLMDDARKEAHTKRAYDPLFYVLTFILQVDNKIDSVEENVYRACKEIGVKTYADAEDDGPVQTARGTAKLLEAYAECKKHDKDGVLLEYDVLTADPKHALERIKEAKALTDKTLRSEGAINYWPEVCRRLIEAGATMEGPFVLSRGVY